MASMRIFRRSILKSGILRGLRVSSKLVAIQGVVREFQSHDFQEPHWPHTDYKRILVVKDNVGLSGGKIVNPKGIPFA
jgi:hypothetical protein